MAFYVHSLIAVTLLSIVAAAPFAYDDDDAILETSVNTTGAM